MESAEPKKDEVAAEEKPAEQQPEGNQEGLDESMALAKQLQEQQDAEMANEEGAGGEGEGMDAQEKPKNEGDADTEEPVGKPVTPYIKADLAKQLMDMGFSKNSSEKALFMVMSKGQSIENATEWLYEHMEDADFNEELLIVGQEGAGQIKQQYAGGLSKEERLKIAEEKIKAGRIRRAEEEKKNAHEMELSRLAGGKAQAAAKRAWEDQERAIALEQRKKDKIELADAKKKALIRIERDRCERQNIPFDETKFLDTVAAKAAAKPPLELIKHGIKTVKTLYTEDRQPGVAKTCLTTISKYVGNVIKDPSEPKFQSINLGNEAFQKRVGKINGGVVVLKGFGFIEDAAENKLTLKAYDAKVFQEGMDALKAEI